MSIKTEVTIDAIIHATEDIKKYYEAFEKIFDMKSEIFSIQNLTGHYDNPITLLNVKLTKNDANNFIEKFIEKIPKDELDIIIEDLDELISSAGLHLRFDKQEFVRGKLSLQEKNAIKVKIYTPVYNKKETAESYLALLERSN